LGRVEGENKMTRCDVRLEPATYDILAQMKITLRQKTGRMQSFDDVIRYLLKNQKAKTQ